MFDQAIEDALDRVVEKWVHLGICYGARPADEPPDPEPLLITTSHLMTYMPRLFDTTFTWLVYCGHLVATTRLEQLAAALPDGEPSAYLGMTLDFANDATRTGYLDRAIAACRSVSPARPFLINERKPVWCELPEREAHPISRKWGLLISYPQLKKDAIRPVSWILEHNPTLRKRARSAPPVAPIPPGRYF